MMQDWTKRIAEEYNMQKYQMDISLALHGAQNSVQRAQNADEKVEEDDSDGEFEGRKRPQKKVGSIEALLKK